MGQSVTNNSLTTAACALWQSFGISVTPKAFEKYCVQNLDKDFIELLLGFDKHLHLAESGLYGTWPTGQHAVIKFHYQPQDQPYIEVDGSQQANMVDFYALVADFNEHTIFDNGQVAEAKQYGLPAAWGVFSRDNPVQATAPKAVAKGRVYRLLSGQMLSTVAADLGCSVKELMDHNGITDPRVVKEGFELHLPFPKKVPADKVAPISYEVYGEPKPMHVSFETGTRKYSFGQAIKWPDIKETGPTYPKDTNVDILAVAHVPVEGTTAHYYMDKLGFGDYMNTGRVAYTIGFNHQHLSTGHVVRVKAPAPKEPVVQPIKSIAVMPATHVDIREPVEDPNLYKTSYVRLPESRRYTANRDVWVHDLDGRREDKPLYNNREVVIVGTFVKDNVHYGRPKGAAENGLWYGVPMSALVDNKELYNVNVPLAERVITKQGRLSFVERYVTEPLARALSQSERLRQWLVK